MNKKTEDKPEDTQDEAPAAPRSLLDRLSLALLGAPASREDLVQLLRDAAGRDLIDRDSLDMIGPRAREVQDDSWNERDPQLPRSKWWLSDGPFAGFRLARSAGL